MAAPGKHVIGPTPARMSSHPLPRVLYGVFDTLAQQHRQILELLRDAGAADGATKRKERWLEARRRLMSHERAEARVVFGPLDGNEAARSVLAQHAAQADELDLAMRELEAVHIDSDDWIERLRDVMAMLDDHVRDEESDFFSMAQRLLGEVRAAELDEAYLSAQRDELHELSA